MSRNVSVVITDDINGEPGARTVTFALESKSYEIDLTDDHVSALRQALAPWMAAARPVRPAGEVPAPRRRPDVGEPTAAEVRAWAREAGLSVPDRGRLPDHLRERYAAAH
jgi:hypothetical protein